MCKNTFSSPLFFVIQHRHQKYLWRLFCVDHRHGIDKVVLVEDAQRCATVERRMAKQPMALAKPMDGLKISDSELPILLPMPMTACISFFVSLFFCLGQRLDKGISSCCVAFNQRSPEIDPLLRDFSSHGTQG